MENKKLNKMFETSYSDIKATYYGGTSGISWKVLDTETISFTDPPDSTYVVKPVSYSEIVEIKEKRLNCNDCGSPHITNYLDKYGNYDDNILRVQCKDCGYIQAYE